MADLAGLTQTHGLRTTTYVENQTSEGNLSAHGSFNPFSIKTTDIVTHFDIPILAQHLFLLLKKEGRPSRTQIYGHIV